MKIKNHELGTPNIEVIAIPRGAAGDIIFKAQAIMSMDEFNTLCPEPKPGTKMARGGKKVEDKDSSGYKDALTLYNKRRLAWMVITSLKATEGLEWDTVKDEDPSTWENYETELKEAKFSTMEVNRIVQGVLVANCLDEDRVEEARKRFLLTLEAPADE